MSAAASDIAFIKTWSTDQVRAELNYVQRRLQNKRRSGLTEREIHRFSLRRTRLEQVLMERIGLESQPEALTMTVAEARAWAYANLPPLYSHEEIANTPDDEIAELRSAFDDSDRTAEQR